MKLRWKIAIAAAVVVIGALIAGAVFLSQSRGPDPKLILAVEETRTAVRQQGFKTDLSEFSLSTSKEMREREAAILAGDFTRTGQDSSWFALIGGIDLVAVTTPQTAKVLWREPKLPDRTGQEENLWPQLEEIMSDKKEVIERSTKAISEGPFRFDLNASAGNAMLLPHLARLKGLEQIFGFGMLLDLRKGDTNRAWTNLLAASHLITKWEVEPVSIAYLVRAACIRLAYGATWEALQYRNWSDTQLASLQKDWESVDLIKGFQETVAFQRAGLVNHCQLERIEAATASGPSLKEIVQNPRYVWMEYSEYKRRQRYLQEGTYQDEKALLLFYRDREIAVKEATMAPSWSAMKTMRAVTDSGVFQSTNVSSMQTMVNLGQGLLNMQNRNESGGVFGRLAEAEAQRRLIITAIALERYRIRHGAYPKELDELSPEIVKTPLMDFMDGKPLLYKPTETDFLLYSVGRDLADNEGKMRVPRQRGPIYGADADRPTTVASDIVWPRVASQRDLEEKRRLEEEQRAMREKAEEERLAMQETLRQERVKDLLAKKDQYRTQDAKYHGKLLSQLLRNESASEKSMSIDQMLTLSQVITNTERDVAMFVVPVSFDAAKKVGRLTLLVDGQQVDPFESGMMTTLTKSPNGNCLITWNTAFSPPGQHALQACVVTGMESENDDPLEVGGPILPFTSTNVCQFFPARMRFDGRSASLYAKLSKPVATYSIEIKAEDGSLLRTIKGSTTNGIINTIWDCKDERGRKYTRGTFTTDYNVDFPDEAKPAVSSP